MPHIHEKIDFTVSVYIICGDKMLFRLHEKHKMWLVPGGHVELDEDIVQTVKKEVKEEVGLDIKVISSTDDDFGKIGDTPEDGENLPVPMFINRHRINPTHEHLDFRYIALSDSMDINPGPGENADPESFRWLTADEVSKMDDFSDRIKYEAHVIFEKHKNR